MTAKGREQELLAEVARLRVEVDALRSELEILRAKGSRRTASANRARSSRAAELDNVVLEAAVGHLQELWGFPIGDDRSLRQLGYPGFPSYRRLPLRVAWDLNARKVPAPLQPT